MAIFGSLKTVRAQTKGRDANYAAAFDYIAECAKPGSAARSLLNSLAAGGSARVDLGGGAFALPQVYMTKASRESGFFESHLAYADVQAVIVGEEIIEVADTAGLEITEKLAPGKDLVKYAMPPPGKTSRLRLRAGDLAVLDPADAHMPCVATGGGPALVRKVVVKIPVA
jgi:YhcH/YjgK/YiaL family protein